MFLIQVVDNKKKTQFYVQKFFPKIVPFLDNVEKYGTAEQATDDNIIRRMRVACWITKATNTHSTCNTYFFFTTTMGASMLCYTHIACLVL